MTWVVLGEKYKAAVKLLLEEPLVYVKQFEGAYRQSVKASSLTEFNSRAGTALAFVSIKYVSQSKVCGSSPVKEEKMGK